MRVALYSRVSTEEQALHGLSISDQQSHLEAWAKEHHHQIVGFYTDAGISARKAAKARPELQRLLSDVEDGLVDLIVFTKLDRWFRNISEYYKVQDVLDSNGVAWQAIYEDYETTTASGRLKVNIMLSVAQDEADRASERIKAVYAHKKEQNLWVAGIAPLGMKTVDKHLTIDPDTAPIVQEVFADYLSFGSIYHAGRMLLDKYKIERTHLAVKAMLTNERYIGKSHGEQVCEPLINPDDFDTVQRMLQSRGTRNSYTGRIWLFTGLIYCPVCGRRFVATSSGKYRYYMCHRHQGVKLCSNAKRIREDKLEQYLLEKLPIAAEEHNARIRAQKKKPAVDISTIKQRMNKLTDLYMADLIDREKYEHDYRELQEKLIVPKEPKPISKEAIMQVRDAYDQLPPEGKRELWNKFVRRIELSENGEILFELI
jgi:site-specific DNA recombinase